MVALTYQRFLDNFFELINVSFEKREEFGNEQKTIKNTAMGKEGA